MTLSIIVELAGLIALIHSDQVICDVISVRRFLRQIPSGHVLLTNFDYSSETVAFPFSLSVHLIG